MQVLRWGIVGCGNISSDFVTALRLAERNHRVCCINLSVLYVFRWLLPLLDQLKRLPSLCKNFNLVFGRTGVIPTCLAIQMSVSKLFWNIFIHLSSDIVYIGVQNIAHASLTIQALNAGKHVLCEKPMAVNGREVREMIETARKNNKFLMEVSLQNFWFFYFYLGLMEPLLSCVDRDSATGLGRRARWCKTLPSKHCGTEPTIWTFRLWDSHNVRGSLLCSPHFVFIRRGNALQNTCNRRKERKR
jgi:hypothetical protein